VPSSRLLLSPDGDVRRDTGLDQPTEELACAVGRVGDETLGLEPQPLLGPRDHSLGGSDLVTGSGRRGFHVDQADVYNQVVKELSEGRKRSHWMWFVFPQPEPIIFRMLAYRLQADRWGDVDPASQRLLDRAESPEQAGQNAVALCRTNRELRPGSMLGREWNGRMHRVAVRADGFAWNGNTYCSLSQIAFAITGTRWNGPRFFGLRDKPAKGSSS